MVDDFQMSESDRQVTFPPPSGAEGTLAKNVQLALVPPWGHGGYPRRKSPATNVRPTYAGTTLRVAHSPLLSWPINITDGSSKTAPQVTSYRFQGTISKAINNSAFG